MHSGPLLTAADLRRIEIRLLALPMKLPLAAAHDSTPGDDRLLTVIGVETTDGVVGWGECSALNQPTYTPEWAEGSFDLLTDWIDEPTIALPVASHPMTAAGLEMALLDAELRGVGTSLAERLGATSTTVRAGATIGLLPVEDSIRAVHALVDEGYRRVKVKIDPSQVDLVPHELSHVFSDLDIQVDANGSLDDSHFMALLSLADHGVTAIEQPFPVDRPDLTAEFMSVASIPVLADEGVGSIADAETLLAAGALGGIAIKPPRVGGLAAAVDVLRWCVDHGVAASVGGMLESGLGRHALAGFAACDGFTITGDLSPAGRWLATDPWADIDLVDGQISVPTGAGVAPLPDLELLDRLTLRRSERSR